jgi:8-oxo-dGTP diphosphatase
MIEVVAGVIEREGCVLVCRRRQDQRHPGKWEFPGGKVEAGETPAEALARELEEELGVRAVIGTELARYAFAYPGRPPILLMFFSVRDLAGEPSNLQFAGMEWSPKAALGGYDFVEGDLEFVARFCASG